MPYPIVSVLTPPSSESLISLSTVKLYLGESGTENDTLYSSLISSASSSMIRFLGVSPARQRYQEQTYGNLTYRLHLSRLPVEPGTLSLLIDGVADTDFALEDPGSGQLYRESLWPWVSHSREPNLTLIYHAGFLLPDQVESWTASAAYVVGDWVRPTASSLYRYECTTAGTSGASEPSWSTTLGATVTDGAVVWTVRAAQELPAFVSQWCYAEFLRLKEGLDRAHGLASWAVEGVTESYFATQTSSVLSPPVMDGLRGWRSELGYVGVA